MAGYMIVQIATFADTDEQKVLDRIAQMGAVLSVERMDQ